MADLSMPESRAPRKIEIGDTFERLTVVGPADRPYHWLCQCSCGNPRLRPVRGACLRSGNTRSCGCLQRERSAETARARATHGEGGGSGLTPEYLAWQNMKDRCHNPNNQDAKDYSERGIAVCDRWRNSYEAFLADMGRRPGPKHTLERIEVDGNYEPGNCVWATWKEQQNNRRNNLLLTHAGKMMTLAQWAEETRMPYSTLHKRLLKGWSIARLLTEKVDTRKGPRK